MDHYMYWYGLTRPIFSQLLRYPFLQIELSSRTCTSWIQEGDLRLVRTRLTGPHTSVARIDYLDMGTHCEPGIFTPTSKVRPTD